MFKLSVLPNARRYAESDPPNIQGTHRPSVSDPNISKNDPSCRPRIRVGHKFASVRKGGSVSHKFASEICYLGKKKYKKEIFRLQTSNITSYVFNPLLCVTLNGQMVVMGFFGEGVGEGGRFSVTKRFPHS